MLIFCRSFGHKSPQQQNGDYAKTCGDDAHYQEIADYAVKQPTQ